MPITVELVIQIQKPTNEAKAEIKTNPFVAETETNNIQCNLKPYKLFLNFLIFISLCFISCYK